MALVASMPTMPTPSFPSPSSWTSSLPYAPLRASTSSSVWNSSPSSSYSSYTPSHSSSSYTQSYSSPSVAVNVKPRLRLAVVVESTPQEKTRAKPRFDPFADEPSTHSQNIAPSTTSSTTTPTTPTRGRRRSPSFSAGAGGAHLAGAGNAKPSVARLAGLTLASQVTHYTRASYAPSSSTSTNQYALHASAPSPAPSLTRSTLSSTSQQSQSPSITTTDAPTPFHARHYPTPDARARLLARTLLTRINPVGRPRSSCSSQLRSSHSSTGKAQNGYEGVYVPSRLSVCVASA